MAATLRLLAGQGYDGFGMREVAAEADATTGSIYHFFANKDDLCKATLDHYRARIADEERTMTGGPEPALERLTRTLEWLASSTRPGWRRDLALAHFNEARRSGSAPPRTADEPMPFAHLLRQPVLDAVAEGRLVVPHRFSADDLADLFMVTATGAVQLGTSKQATVKAATLLELLAALLVGPADR